MATADKKAAEWRTSEQRASHKDWDEALKRKEKKREGGGRNEEKANQQTAVLFYSSTRRSHKVWCLECRLRSQARESSTRLIFRLPPPLPLTSWLFISFACRSPRFMKRRDTLTNLRPKDASSAKKKKKRNAASLLPAEYARISTFINQDHILFFFFFLRNRVFIELYLAMLQGVFWLFFFYITTSFIFVIIVFFFLIYFSCCGGCVCIISCACVLTPYCRCLWFFFLFFFFIS